MRKRISIELIPRENEDGMWDISFKRTEDESSLNQCPYTIEHLTTSRLLDVFSVMVIGAEERKAEKLKEDFSA